MKEHNEVYFQTVKHNILSWITTSCIVAALLLAIKEAPNGMVITLMGIAAIQGYRAERAERLLRQIDHTAKKADPTDPNQ